MGAVSVWRAVLTVHSQNSSKIEAAPGVDTIGVLRRAVPVTADALAASVPESFPLQRGLLDISPSAPAPSPTPFAPLSPLLS